MTSLPTARDLLANRFPLISGVRLLALEPHPDERGTFVELFRDAWDLGPRPVQ